MKSLFVLVALFSCVIAENTVFTKCDGSSDDICEVNAVTITPCPNKNYCKLKKGKDANINFDFTPNFAATKMRASLFWASSSGDVPFPNLTEADACTLTSCPLESGKKQELNYKLRISKIFPSGTFLLKWKLYNEENEKQLCCFQTTIKLTK